MKRDEELVQTPVVLNCLLGATTAMKVRRQKLVALYMPTLAGGGAERVFLHLAQGFAERGYEVHLVLAKAQGSYLSQVPSCVRMIDLGASRVLASLPKLICYLRREQPHVLLSALDHANAVAICARGIARVSTRVIATVHNTPSQVVANASTLRARLLPLWARLFYRWSDVVVAVSRGVANDLVHYVGIPTRKVKVIYNPVVTSELFRKAEEPLYHPWFRAGEPPVILGVGRLTKQKDFPTLIRAFALVRRHRSVRLMILGEGEERPQLERLIRELKIEDDVALPGFVANPYPYMKRAAVFVLSSRWEGLPTVLVEAMALGVPIVSTNCPSGAAEILGEGRLGLLVEVGDELSMAQAIIESLDCSRAVRTSRHCNQFTLGQAVQQYENLFV